jgi:hypothetical protein
MKGYVKHQETEMTQEKKSRRALPAVLLIIGLLIISVAGVAIYGYGSLKTDFTTSEFSPRIGVPSGSSLAQGFLNLLSGDWRSAFGGVLQDSFKGLEVEGDLTFYNPTFAPVYIPAMTHQVKIEGELCRQAIETPAGWLSAGASRTDPFALFIDADDLPEIALESLRENGEVDVEVVSKIPVGPFTLTKTTRTTCQLTAPQAE